MIIFILQLKRLVHTTNMEIVQNYKAIRSRMGLKSRGSNPEPSPFGFAMPVAALGASPSPASLSTWAALP